MSVLMIGTPLYTADNSSAIPVEFQRFKVSSGAGNYVLRAVGIEVILYNDPVFASLKAELWNVGSNLLPSIKIGDSTTSFTSLQILPTQPHAWTMCSFAFNLPTLREQVNYAVTIRADNTYVGDVNSHLAMRNGYPDPQYMTGITVTQKNADTMPLAFSFIGAPL